jgi:hypothetical protein
LETPSNKYLSKPKPWDTDGKASKATRIAISSLIFMTLASDGRAGIEPSEIIESYTVAGPEPAEQDSMAGVAVRRSGNEGEFDSSTLEQCTGNTTPLVP